MGRFHSAAVSALLEAGSTTATAWQDGSAAMASRWRRPMGPAPTTAKRTGTCTRSDILVTIQRRQLGGEVRFQDFSQR